MHEVWTSLQEFASKLSRQFWTLVVSLVIGGISAVSEVLGKRILLPAGVWVLTALAGAHATYRSRGPANDHSRTGVPPPYGR